VIDTKVGESAHVAFGIAMRLPRGLWAVFMVDSNSLPKQHSRDRC